MLWMRSLKKKKRERERENTVVYQYGEVRGKGHGGRRGLRGKNHYVQNKQVIRIYCTTLGI